jgi:hypothetical protein
MDSHNETHRYILWVMLASAGLHVAEEYLLDFVSFAVSHGVALTWREFDVINMAYIVAGIAAGGIGWRAPALSLSYPALLLTNFVFHTSMSFVDGHPNPGVFTSVLLFLPVGICCFVFAARDGVLTRRRTITAIVLGVVLQSYAGLLVILRDLFAY